MDDDKKARLVRSFTGLVGVMAAGGELRVLPSTDTKTGEEVGVVVAYRGQDDDGWYGVPLAVLTDPDEVTERYEWPKGTAEVDGPPIHVPPDSRMN